MAGYLELSNGSVWYDEQGSGEPLVMLHGGAVDSRFFDANVASLAERLRVIRTDLWGHGRTADREGPFSLDSFADDVAELIERVAGGPAHVFGHSIGAGVAMVLAMRRPELVRRLVLASGGFNVEADAPVDIDAAVEQTVEFLGSTYGEVSPDGEEHFPVVTRKDFELSSREPSFSAEQIGAIAARTLVLTADDDLTPLEHTVEMYRAIPISELAVVPGTSHFFLQEKPDASNAILLEFLTRDPVPLVAPIRRAPAEAAGAPS
jgi:pimeloyl-ACP methyl ester carboxylesterase